MPVDLDDRLDRNNRNISEGSARTQDQLYELGKQVVRVATQVEGLTKTVETGLANVDSSFREFNSRYATKDDLKTVADEIVEVKKNLARGVWIVLTAVILGALSLLFKAGLVHT